MRVAVVGAGIMGAGMARSLARAGHQVVVWNRTRSKAEAVGGGITVADTVSGAVGGSEVVLTILFDTEAVLAITDELVGALGPESVWLQASTVGPDGVRRIAEAAGEAAGSSPGRLVDAPVLGTRKPAEDGALVVLVAGDEAVVQRATPVLEAIGSRTVPCGTQVGRASALKLACNSWVALVNAGTAQALALAAGQGVDPALFLAAIEGGAVDTPYAHVKGAAMTAGDHTEVAFEVDGVRKDLGLMIDAASGAGVEDGLLRAMLDLYDRASERGHGSQDMGAVRTAFDA